MLNDIKIILASGSPRRRQLLSSLGVEFEVVDPNVDESYQKGMAPDEITKSMACKKAAAVAKKYKNYAIIAADTIVAIDGIILEKPKDRQDALNMLNMLSGRWHEVHSGVCIVCKDKSSIFNQVTRVHFSELDNSQIKWYVNTLEPMDKAGAYGIQGYGSMFVDRIEGDFYNVMGFPISKIMKELTKLKIYDVRA